MNSVRTVTFRAASSAVIAVGAAASLGATATPALRDWPSHGFRAAPATTEHISVGFAREEGNDGSSFTDVSSGCRYVLFGSKASNWQPGDTPGTGDVYIRDRSSGSLELVSRGVDGRPANGRTDAFDMSTDGRFVVMTSSATNLVDDAVGAGLFIRDRSLGMTQRITLVSATADRLDVTDAATSDDGRYVMLASTASSVLGETDPQGHEGSYDAFVTDRATGVTTVASVQHDGGASWIEPNSPSPMLSRDGRYVMFESTDPALVRHDTNGQSDVFVRDLRRGTTKRVSTDARGRQFDAGAKRAVMSPNGLRYGFLVRASLSPKDDDRGWDIYVKDLRSGRIEFASPSRVHGPRRDPVLPQSMSAKGRHIAFLTRDDDFQPRDTDGRLDLFVRDLRTGTTRLASLKADGGAATAHVYGGTLSADASCVGFTTSQANRLSPSDTNQLADAYVRVDSRF